MKGPTKKEEAKKETVKSKESRDKKQKQKGFLLHSWLTKNEQFQTTEEAKVAACKTRKRKERQESVSSMCQDHKVIRSNSEERPHSRRHHEKEKIIRRVSSSEDLHLQIVLKNKTKQTNSKENVGSSETNILIQEECENEKRRSHERIAVPFTVKCKKSYQKKSKGKVLHKSRNSRIETVESSKIETKLDDNTKQSNRSPSPLKSSPLFDFSTLHQQVDDTEPLPSCSNRVVDTTPSLSIVPNRLLSSPRNSIIATHCIYLEPDTGYNAARKTINPVELKLQKISKQLSVMKKKLRKYENEYQAKHGCKPSHLDKMSDGTMRKHYMELTKLKREYKLLQEFDVKSIPGPNNNPPRCEESQNLRTIVAETELRLQAKREAANRNVAIEEMAHEQLVEEKLAVQKALLHLENVYGRPNEKEDRDIVRPLYDRYRTLKRLISKAVMGSSISNDLETIHEDETIHFVVDTSKSDTSTTEKLSTWGTITDSSDTDVSVSENFHSMDCEALKQQMLLATEEKKTLKRTIKENEISMQQKSGKLMLQEKDKSQIEQLYKNYKTVKSKIKLLEALIAKID